MRLFSILLCSFWIYSVIADDVDIEAPKYVTPMPSGDVYFVEPFDADDALDSWVLSKADKEGVESEISKYNGQWLVEEASSDALPGDTGLVLKDKAKHHAISTPLDKPFVFEDKTFVLQYEVNFQDGIECGGAYMKLLSLSDDLNLNEFHDKTAYTIMFGPDKCGEDYKLHFIFQHKNPLTGLYEEKHAKKPSVSLNSYYTDKKPHLYTLIINPDNSFQIFIDQEEVSSGSLLEDMTPPVNPPKEIEDPDDKKPEDWDDRETIPDETATKPDDWDEDAPMKLPDSSAQMPSDWLESEPLFIDDPDASKPEDWEDDIDGEWEAPKIDNPRCADVSGCGIWEPPMIDNPEYKGKWKAPHISNPAYKGTWKPKIIPNPDYFFDENPFKMATIGAIGFELWSMSSEILFDNIIISSYKSVVDDFAADSWSLKKQLITSNQPGLATNLLSAASERPWLWIIYILVVALPIILILSFCCRKSSSPSEDPKKTDAITEDDPHQSEEDEEEEEEEEEVAAEEVAVEEVAVEEEEQEATSRDDLEEESPVEEDTSDANNQKPHKRKPRVQD